MKSPRVLRVRQYAYYAYLIPLFSLLFLFLLYPLAFQIVLSFYKVPMNLQFSFVGLKNFQTLIRDPEFITSLRNAIVFVGGSVAGQCGFGFSAALVLRSIKVGKDIFRAIFLIPWLLSDISIGTMFIILFHDQYGTINEMLLSLGLNKIVFLVSTEHAIWVVTAANVWKSSCIVMAICSAGLASIPEDLYEAAQVDGASFLQRFRRITGPLMKSFLVLSLIITTMATFNYIGLIFVMTGGGPLESTTVPAFQMFRWAVEWGNLGYAAAIGVFILIVNLICAGTYIKFLLKR